MLKYTIKRLLHLIPIIIAISFLIFLIADFMPGDAFLSSLGDLVEAGQQPSIQQIIQVRSILGLDQPIHIRYKDWVLNLVSGNFGYSLVYRRPVVNIIKPLIKNSFILSFTSAIMMFLIAVPIGIKSAIKKYGAFDNTFSLITFLSISIPAVFFPLMLIYWVAVPVEWIPGTGMRSVTYIIRGYPNILIELIDIVKHMLLPVTAATFLGFGAIARYIRSAVIDVINQDYIRTARAKGLSEKVVIYKHALRNALVPIVTIIGLTIPTLFIGNIIIEAMFNWPGVGTTLIGAIRNRDTQMITASNLFFALICVFSNLMTDLLYGVVDPRIRVK